MKINFVSPEYSMVEYTLLELKNLAGVNSGDSELEEDLKVTQWLGDQSYRVIEFDRETYSVDLHRAVADRIEVLIIKEN